MLKAEALLLQQEAALQEAVAQGQERERLLLDQHQQVSLALDSIVLPCYIYCCRVRQTLKHA